MNNEELKSGDFLEDVDITISLRSGHTDIQILQNLSKAIVASVIELCDSDVVVAEQELKVKSTPGKSLSSIIILIQV